MTGYDEMPQYATSVAVELKKRDILLIRNILREICYGGHPMLEVEFETLLGNGFNKKYVGNLCTFFRKIMDENGIVD